MNSWLSWVVPLMGTLLIALVPAMLRAYALMALLMERCEVNKTANQKEREERLSAHAEVCRRLDTVEATISSQGNMLNRIDERTALMLSGLQQAGVVERPFHRERE